MYSYGYKEWNDVPSIDYDDYESEKFKGIMYDKSNDNKVIMDTCLAGHHDIISYFDEYCGTNDFVVKVVDSKEEDEDISEDERFYVQINFLHVDEVICIHDGHWYFA